MTESSVRDLLAQRLTQAGFSVFSEVPCREQAGHSPRRIDLLALAPQSWSRTNGFRTIGIEVKDVAHHSDMIDALHQAATYVRCFCFRKDAVHLPRPDLVLIATKENMASQQDHAHRFVLDRVAWKLGTSILWRTDGTISFDFTHNGAVSNHVLFHARGAQCAQ